MKLLLLILLPFLTIPKKTNTIEVSGVTFNQVANALLDAGYTFERIDSNYLTIKTDFKAGNGKLKDIKYRLMIRVKDSTAIITGEWYNKLFIGATILGTEQTIEGSTYQIQYTTGNEKNCFLEMNSFALSLNGEVEYKTK